MTPALMHALVVGAGLPAKAVRRAFIRGQARSHMGKAASTLGAR